MLVNAEDKQSSQCCVAWQFPESGADAAFKDLRTLGFFELEGTRITKNENCNNSLMRRQQRTQFEFFSVTKMYLATFLRA